jgi:two-component sensor histidine kinase
MERPVARCSERIERGLVNIILEWGLLTACSSAALFREQIMSDTQSVKEHKRESAAINEVTRLRRSCDALAHAALDGLSAHIAILDEHGAILAVNKAWRAFAQANAPTYCQVCEGANYLVICERARGAGSEEAGAAARGIRSVLSGECESFRLEYPCHSAQEQRWYELRVTRLPGSGQAGVIVAHENITARKQVEAELWHRLTEIEMLNARLRRAMAGTHHRVGNNLQVIAALAELQKPEKGDMVPVAAIQRVMQHVRALSEIHHLLTQEAHATGEAEHVSTREALEHLLPLIQGLVGDRHIQAQVQEMRLSVRQATALSILVTELVNNAARHGWGNIMVSLSVAGNQAQLSVSDEGGGFAKGFDPNAAEYNGLHLIENITKWDLRGRICYENRPEGGARVVVTFPIACMQ